MNIYICITITNNLHTLLHTFTISQSCKPLTLQRPGGQRCPFHRNFNSILRRDRQKNFLWASSLWVGRQKEPILGYVRKNNEKKNLDHKGLILNISYFAFNVYKFNIKDSRAFFFIWKKFVFKDYLVFIIFFIPFDYVFRFFYSIFTILLDNNKNNKIT